MLEQTVLLREPFVTVRTVEFLETIVNFPMPYQVRNVPKSFVALLTAVGFVSRVNSLVGIQIVFLEESLAASTAFETLLFLMIPSDVDL